MERFVFEVIEPFLPTDLPEERRQERVSKIMSELRAFIKGEMVPINKELAKKSRELFVACSDVENLKEKVETLEKEVNKLRSEVAFRDNELVKQKVIFERDFRELEEQTNAVKKELRKTIKDH